MGLIPTGPLSFLESKDHEIGEIFVVQERRATVFKVPKFTKSTVGMFLVR